MYIKSHTKLAIAVDIQGPEKVWSWHAVRTIQRKEKEEKDKSTNKKKKNESNLFWRGYKNTYKKRQPLFPF